jgi:endonuclease/exonuclease/phosphatase (EEP) superfamily protein YafD
MQIPLQYIFALCRELIQPWVILVCLFLATGGCVSIPANHYTVARNGLTCSVNDNCRCAGRTLPDTSLFDPLPARGLDPEQIVLLNWNAYKQTTESWLHRLGAMLRDVDLLTLQEAVATEKLRDFLSREAAMDWILANAFSRSGTGTGVLTASRTRPDFYCSSRTAEPIIVVPKTLLITRYPVAGRSERLLLVNMHLVNFSLSTSAYRQQLKEAAGLIRQHHGPLIIAGDFNTWSRQRLEILRDFAAAAGAMPVSFVPDHRIRIFGHRLDFIFSRGLEVVEATTTREPLSDHNPMRVVFRLQTTR